MASNKRKTLQIKRPDPNSPKSKKKPLPKVDMDENAATSAIDTDELGVIGPRTAKMKRPGDEDGSKGNTTRISLPDEDKIRKARRATTTQNLEEEGALPSAEQIEQAQKNATMPIMIDTEDVQDNERRKLEDTGESEADRTMEIDVDSLQTGDVGKDLEKAGKSAEEDKDQTMQIDPEALATGNLGKDLEEAGKSADEDKDQTMRIDPDALATGDVGKDLEQAGAGETSDKTMQIDADSLATGRVDKVDETDELMSSETMRMDEPIDEEEALEQEKAFNAATTSIDEPVEEEEQDSGTNLTAEEMKESFNARTMEMDPDELESELSKSETASQEIAQDELDQTMDLTKERPKTIMIKRPSREAGSSTPTVKAVRPDAPTVRTARPVTASPSSPKEGTSRIDVPESEGGATKEGKTIKLRRPAGAPGSGSRVSPASRVAGSAGLAMGADGTVRSTLVKQPDLGGGWLAVAIVTFLVSLGAIWTTLAITQPALPMPGRLVDADNNLVSRP